MPIAPITPQQAVDYLNELARRDARALHALLDVHVPANEDLAIHPTAQVREVEPGNCWFGMLGLLNGLFGVYDQGEHAGWGAIVSVCHKDDPSTLRFRLLSSIPK